SGDSGEIRAHQGEVMAVIDLPDAPDALQRGLVTDVASQGIGGVGGVDNHLACQQRLGGLPDQSGFGIFRMYFEVLRHGLHLTRLDLSNRLTLRLQTFTTTRKTCSTPSSVKTFPTACPCESPPDRPTLPVCRK